VPIILWLLSSMIAPAGAADARCTETATSWLQALTASGCPRAQAHVPAASEACAQVDLKGWTRDQRQARKAYLDRCAPSAKGLPGAQIALPDGRRISPCTRFILAARGEEEDAPTPTSTTPGVGLDALAGVIGNALFQCQASEALSECRRTSTVHTPADQINAQIQWCESLQTDQLDAAVSALARMSPGFPIQPEERLAILRGHLDAQRVAAEKVASQAKALEDARAAELQRALLLSRSCMVPLPDMHHPSQAQKASSACQDLLVLWQGYDSTREALHQSGSLAPRVESALEGKVLNAESLQVADPTAVQARPALLETRRVFLVKKVFPEVLQRDGSAAAANFLSEHGKGLDEAWVTEAQDRMLAAEAAGH